jgi:hypothetical protein
MPRVRQRFAVISDDYSDMDGDTVNPGDLHGRVLPANDVELCWDGNLIKALVGPDPVIGVSGFGDAVHDALRELADNLVQEAVWIEIADQAALPSPPPRRPAVPSKQMSLDSIIVKAASARLSGKRIRLSE